MISFEDVVARRGPHQVLNGVSLTVAPGEVVALVGRSGSGKTTMLRLVNRMLALASGAVRVGGRDVSEWDAITLRRQTGYAIQDVGLFPHLSVAQNIAVVPHLMQWDERRIAERIDELLMLVGLEAREFGHRRPDQLSGGQRQRVGLARALAADPPVLHLGSAGVQVRHARDGQPVELRGPREVDRAAAHDEPPGLDPEHPDEQRGDGRGNDPQRPHGVSFPHRRAPGPLVACPA